MQTHVKTVLVLVALGMACSTAQVQAQSRQLVGTAGYLSEWELKGAVMENISSGRSEFSGQVVWKHIGLCSANGPEEKRGEIRARINRSGSVSRIDATLSLEKIQCTYSANFSDNTSGVMDCSDAKGVPLAFSFK